MPLLFGISLPGIQCCQWLTPSGNLQTVLEGHGVLTCELWAATCPTPTAGNGKGRGPQGPSVGDHASEQWGSQLPQLLTWRNESFCLRFYLKGENNLLASPQRGTFPCNASDPGYRIILAIGEMPCSSFQILAFPSYAPSTAPTGLTICSSKAEAPDWLKRVRGNVAPTDLG